MSRLTKNEMVKDIFFAATEGKRTLDNYVAGMSMIDMIAENNWAWAIKDWWNKVNNGANPKTILDQMFEQTLLNVRGVNLNETGRSEYLRSCYKKIF